MSEPAPQMAHEDLGEADEPGGDVGLGHHVAGEQEEGNS